MKTPKAKLSLNIQHDYITLRTPNGNFTTSYGGARASGILARNLPAFDAIDAYITREQKAGRTNGAIFASLATPAILASLWPEWDKVPVLPDLKPGDFVVPDPAFAKKYPGKLEVASVKGKYAYLKTAQGVIGFPLIDLTKAE